MGRVDRIEYGQFNGISERRTIATLKDQNVAEGSSTLSGQLTATDVDTTDKHRPVET